jgi:hypothetical protein
MENERTYTAFAGEHLLVSADLKTAVLSVKQRLDAGETAPVLIFDDHSGKQLDFDLRGTPKQALDRLAGHPHFSAADGPSAPRSGPGRPKLGVLSREVGLLPRHWDWLEQQPQGISGALRKLVEEARRREPDKARARQALEAADKVMWALAGDRPGCEDASRALYAGDRPRFEKLIQAWPKDIRIHLQRLTKP